MSKKINQTRNNVIRFIKEIDNFIYEFGEKIL